MKIVKSFSYRVAREEGPMGHKICQLPRVHPWPEEADEHNFSVFKLHGIFFLKVSLGQ